MKLLLDDILSKNSDLKNKIVEKTCQNIVVWYSNTLITDFDELKLSTKSRKTLEEVSYKHRYYYYISWEKADNKKVTFIMLNPSIANHHKTDQTIDNCIKMAKKDGYSSLEIVNLYSLRHPKFEILQPNEDIINTIILKEVIKQASTVVLAWGKDFSKTKQGKNIIKALNIKDLLESKEIKVIGGEYPYHPSPSNLNRLKKSIVKEIMTIDLKDMWP